MNRIEYRRRAVPRIAGTDPQQYEVSARIVSQTQEDGSPLDTPLQLDTCDSGPCGENMTSEQRAAAAARAAAKAQAADEARAGGSTGGAGSGGIWPGPGGLPFKIPQPIGYFALGLMALGLFVVLDKRR